MKDLVQRILTEMKSSPEINSEPLVKILAESATKSIALGENLESVYETIRTGLTEINKTLKKNSISVILESMQKIEESIDTKITKIAKEVDLASKLALIKESEAYANPLVKVQVDSFEKALSEGYVDFSIAPNFVDTFSAFKDYAPVRESVDGIVKYMNENRSRLSVLSAIYQMSRIQSPAYAGAINDLKEMLINESYSADILKIKYGKSIPAVTGLISTLRIYEAQDSDGFTLGEGNADTKINNIITTSTPLENGFMAYLDNRFIAIRLSESLTGHEKNVFVDEEIKIAEMEPAWVYENHRAFYEASEAFAKLGFSVLESGMGLESNAIHGAKIGVMINENHELDVLINGKKIEKPSLKDVSEAVAVQGSGVRQILTTLFEKFEIVNNLEFIKEVRNDVTCADALVFNLDGKYFICEQVNAAERAWLRVDEHQLYEFFAKKFRYDISPVFKTAIEEKVDQMKKVEEEKSRIQNDLNKLNETVEKLKTACAKPGLDPGSVNKLETLRENIEQTIKELKGQYVALELKKRAVA